MQSYCKYNNVQKFFSFFVYYRRVWHPAIPTQPPTTEIEKQEGIRIAERKAAWGVCQNSLILKKSQSPDFHKPGLCYV